MRQTLLLLLQPHRYRDKQPSVTQREMTCILNPISGSKLLSNGGLKGSKLIGRPNFWRVSIRDCKRRQGEKSQKPWREGPVGWARSQGNNSAALSLTQNMPRCPSPCSLLLLPCLGRHPLICAPSSHLALMGNLKQNHMVRSLCVFFQLIPWAWGLSILYHQLCFLLTSGSILWPGYCPFVAPS